MDIRSSIGDDAPQRIPDHPMAVVQNGHDGTCHPSETVLIGAAQRCGHEAGTARVAATSDTGLGFSPYGTSDYQVDPATSDWTLPGAPVYPDPTWPEPHGAWYPSAMSNVGPYFSGPDHNAFRHTNSPPQPLSHLPAHSTYDEDRAYHMSQHDHRRIDEKSHWSIDPTQAPESHQPSPYSSFAQSAASAPVWDYGGSRSENVTAVADHERRDLESPSSGPFTSVDNVANTTAQNTGPVIPPGVLLGPVALPNPARLTVWKPGDRFKSRRGSDKVDPFTRMISNIAPPTTLVPHNIPISAAEILIFLPNALLSPAVIVRLLRSGFTRGDLARVQLYAVQMDGDKKRFKREVNRIQKQITEGGKLFFAVPKDTKFKPAVFVKTLRETEDFTANKWRMRSAFKATDRATTADNETSKMTDVRLSDLALNVPTRDFFPEQQDAWFLTQAIIYALDNPLEELLLFRDLAMLIEREGFELPNPLASTLGTNPDADFLARWNEQASARLQ